MTERTIMDRLEENAEWIEANAFYHFQQDQKFGPFTQSKEAVKAMRDAAELLRNLGVGKKIFS
jgi:hypothetical protein